VKTGVQSLCNYLNRLDSGFRRNDKKWDFSTFYEIINDEMSNTASLSAHLKSYASPDCNGCNHHELKGHGRLESYVPQKRLCHTVPSLCFFRDAVEFGVPSHPLAFFVNSALISAEHNE
jgi:hypothetical protein